MAMNACHLCIHVPPQCDFSTLPHNRWSLLLHLLNLGHVTCSGLQGISEHDTAETWKLLTHPGLPAFAARNIKTTMERSPAQPNLLEDKTAAIPVAIPDEWGHPGPSQPYCPSQDDPDQKAHPANWQNYENQQIICKRSLSMGDLLCSEKLSFN